MKSTRIYYIVLLILSVMTITSCTSNQKSDSKETVVLENIATRVSVRSYLDKPVDDANIEKLLRAGMAAPSAMNKQPWHFVVVTDKQNGFPDCAKCNPTRRFHRRSYPMRHNTAYVLLQYKIACHKHYP